MKLPIILSNFGDVLVFATIARAIQYIEPIDVVNREYVAFDGEGRILEITYSKMGGISIEPGEDTPSHAEDLQAILRAFFRAIGLDEAWITTAQLAELVEKGLAYQTI